MQCRERQTLCPSQLIRQAEFTLAIPDLHVHLRGPGSKKESWASSRIGRKHEQTNKGHTRRSVRAGFDCGRGWVGTRTDVRGQRKSTDVLVRWELGNSPGAVGRDGQEHCSGCKSPGQ